MSDIPFTQDDLYRRDREALEAIEIVHSYLDDYWLRGCDHELMVMGCASCQASILHAQLTMLGNSVIENLGEDPESARSELSRQAQELDMGD